MKINITTNFRGRLYQIDEDAYQLLNNYTETIRNYFSKQEEGKEVAEDIEERIAELLDEHLANGNQAVSIENVQEIMNQIGNLNDITGNSENAECNDTQDNSSKAQSSSNTGNYSHTYQPKKFYRDNINRQLCGVIGGCAQYWNQNATTLRWIFVALCAAWMFGGFTLNLFTGFTFLLTPFTILLTPMALAPVLAYFAIALFTPLASSPEDTLRMKGKDINPQTLAEEVKKQSYEQMSTKHISAGNIISGLFTILLAVITGVSIITGIVLMCIGFTDLKREYPTLNEFINSAEFLTFAGTVLCGAASMGVALYCFIHSTACSFKRCNPLTNKIRIILLSVWIVSTIGFGFLLGFTIHFHNQQVQKNYDEERKAKLKVHEQFIISHTHENGLVCSDEDWNFLQEGRWVVVTTENTDRYTYSGEYMTGETDVRYLDADGTDQPVIVTIQRTDTILPGNYMLTAAVRANNEGRFIFAQLEDDPEARLVEIPVTDNWGGDIISVVHDNRLGEINHDDDDDDDYQYLVDMDIDYDIQTLLLERLDEKSQRDLRRISKANNGEGFGWTYVAIKNIVVTKPTVITYGVTTDEEITGVDATTGWFSATDFQLKKIQ